MDMQKKSPRTTTNLFGTTKDKAPRVLQGKPCATHGALYNRVLFGPLAASGMRARAFVPGNSRETRLSSEEDR